MLSWLCHAVPMTFCDSSASSLADSLGEQKVRWANIWRRLVPACRPWTSLTRFWLKKRPSTREAVGMLDLDVKLWQTLIAIAWNARGVVIPSAYRCGNFCKQSPQKLGLGHWHAIGRTTLTDKPTRLSGQRRATTGREAPPHGVVMAE